VSVHVYVGSERKGVLVGLRWEVFGKTGKSRISKTKETGKPVIASAKKENFATRRRSSSSGSAHYFDLKRSS